MRKRNFELNFWLVIFLFSYYTYTNAEDADKNRQTFVIRYKDGEQTIPVTVVLDYKKQTEYVINMNPRSPAKSVTLYDFKQRTIAYKDLTNRECFLGRLTYETLSEESVALQDVKNPVEGKPKLRSLDPGRPALTPTEIRNIAGQKTAVFCRKMNTWLLMPDKSHGISKRDADDFEERTYENHGYHTVRYSHYGRETRRRYRNPGRTHKLRSHRAQGAAENQGTLFPEVGGSRDHHLLNRQPSSNSFNLNSNNLSSNAKMDFSGEYYPNAEISEKPKDLKHQINSSEHRKDNIPAINKMHPIPSHTSKYNFGYQIKYPQFEAGFSSRYEIPEELNISNDSAVRLSSENASKTPIPIHGQSPESAKYFSRENEPSQKIVSEDETHTRTERSTSTTDISTTVHNIEINYTDIHPSLEHLLSEYKPLHQEFEFDPPIVHEIDEFHHGIDPQNGHNKEIETEFDPRSPLYNHPDKPKFENREDENNASHNLDVSTNVLEVPKITKEFENVKNKERLFQQFGNTDNLLQFPNPQEHSASVLQIHSNRTLYPSRNTNLTKENFPDSDPTFFPTRDITHPVNKNKLNENISHIPSLHIFSTAEPSTQTTTRYLMPQISSNDVYPPGHQPPGIGYFAPALPNYTSKNPFNSIHPENNLSNPTVQENYTKFNSKPSFQPIENYFNTTENSLAQKYNTGSNHRSDIPSENDGGNLVSSEQILIDAERFVPNETNGEISPPYKIKYQSVLRDFKPDEIVIDIENIPTHPPPPFTSSFQQRIYTTIQPTVRTLQFDSVRSDISRRQEQPQETTWHSYISTTRHPRRRINDRTRKPNHQNVPSLHGHRSNLNQNHHQLNNRMKQRGRIHHFNQAQSSIQETLHYSGRHNSSPHVRMPSQINQPHLYSQMNNLPPGISVHPRHPQAPFADMVHSNRPPTMPLVDDNQVFPKPHRQRHHRKKDRLTHSCCRQRDKSDSLQSCCRNGGPCCSRSHRRIQVPGTPCCSSSRALNQVNPTNQILPPRIPSNQIQPPLRASNQIQPPLRASNQSQRAHRTSNQSQRAHRTSNQIQSPARVASHLQLPLRTEAGPHALSDKGRCEKERMCRTLYESTQQVMVCRNARVEGC